MGMKTLFAIIFLIVFFLSTMFGTLFVNLAIAQSFEAININADGNINPSTAPITRDGNVYTLTRNILGSITVERFNIVIDGAGYTLQGTGSGRGIEIMNPQNASIKSTYDVTVKNINVRNFEEGIDVFGYWGNTISGVVIFGNNITNNSIGIRFSSYYFYSNNTIVGNNISANDAGIHIEMAAEGGVISSNKIAGNQIANNKIGMRILWQYSIYGDKPNPFQSNNTIYLNNF